MQFCFHLVLLGLGQFLQAYSDIVLPTNQDLTNVKISFEIGINRTSKFSVRLGKLMHQICEENEENEENVKDLKINVEANSSISLHFCSCGNRIVTFSVPEKTLTEELSSDDWKRNSTRMAVCDEKSKKEMYTLDIDVSGNKGTHGSIILQFIDRRKASTIEMYHRFRITEENGVLINLTEFDSFNLSNDFSVFPAGHYQYSLYMILEVDGDKNVTIAFMKCGMKALHLDRLIVNHTFTFEPGMLRMLADVAQYTCAGTTSPLQIWVNGEKDVSGIILFKIEETSESNSEIPEWLFPLIHFTIFGLVVITVIPMIWYVETNTRKEEKEEEDNEIASLWSL